MTYVLAIAVLLLALAVIYLANRRAPSDQEPCADFSPIAHFELDRNGIIRDVNKAFVTALRRRREDIVGRPVGVLFPVETRDERVRHVHSDLQGGDLQGLIPREYLCGDGQRRSFDVHRHVLRGGDGEICGLRCALVDATEARRTSRELQLAHQTFEVMADSIPGLIWVDDARGNCVYVNRRVAEFTGQRAETLHGHRWIDFIHPEDWARNREERQDGNRTGSATFEVRLRDAEGTYRWMLGSDLPRFDANGQYAGSAGWAIDITERRNTEERLRLIESAIVNASEAVAITGREPAPGSGGTIYINAAFTELTGYTWDEIRGRRLSMLFGPETQHETMMLIQERTEAILPVRAELVLHRKNGSSFWAAVDFVPIHNAAGEFTHAVSIVSDISERKHAESEIRRYTQELAERNTALKAALEAAQEATELKSRFLANMSHEIRTPMNGILGMAEVLLTTRLSADQTEYTENIRQCANSLLVLLNDILDLSRIEAGRLELESVPFSIARLVQQTVSLLSLRAISKGLETHCDVDANVPEPVTGDPARLRQVLTNLLGNAIKFTEQGHVRVNVRPAETSGRVRFDVQDSGIGIPLDQQGRMFQRFSQSDDSNSRKYGGSGLGLAISRQLVELMAGEIGFTSTPGAGSTFWFEVPLIPAEPAASPAQPEPAVAECAPQAKRIGRVLVVEDNEINRKVAVAALHRAGLETVTAANGRLAIGAVRRAAYDLILMDVQMPEMDGFAATREIRALEAALGRHTPIIAMTANAMRGDRERCLEAGMDDYISKPVSVARLRSVIRCWVEAPQATPGAEAGSNREHTGQ